MRILITGTAGFIGFHAANRFAADGWEVTGLDSINDYYEESLKYDRLAEAGIEKASLAYNKKVISNKWPKYQFIQLRLEDRENLVELFKSAEPFDVVMNLAAQAGVRFSLTNPFAYADSNIVGFLNLLECCRHFKAGHLVFASSSSVYGLNQAIPFSEHDTVDHPISLYAASKKSNELMAHTYSHLYGLPATGLRFFTVYGPWGRPDMAIYLFTKAIMAGEPIKVFNDGNMQRDFTYVDDIVEGLARVAKYPVHPNAAWNGTNPDPATSTAPYRIYNIGNSSPVKLLDFVEAIEEALGKKAIRQMLPMQDGDVPLTFADTSDLQASFGYKPATSLQHGIQQFVKWYLNYYHPAP